MTRPNTKAKNRGRSALLALVLASVIGCSLEFKGVATEYRLSPSTLAILAEDSEAQMALDRELQRLFGTREAPAFAAPADALNARVPAEQLVTTSEARQGEESEAPSLRESAELYANKCLHCHGNEGGADGPTARFLDPLPRDYRRGIFKYTALKDKARPRRIDLYNTLAEGVYSTAMPNCFPPRLFLNQMIANQPKPKSFTTFRRRSDFPAADLLSPAPKN